MSDYCNTTSYYLPYSFFDFKDELKPSALLDLAQESATASADELGFGYADLKPKGYGFIIVNSYCEFRRPVVLGERVTMQTWPLPPRHVFLSATIVRWWKRRKSLRSLHAGVWSICKISRCFRPRRWERRMQVVRIAP